MDSSAAARFKLLVVDDESLGVQTLGIVTFALLTAIGAQLVIPRQPVPYTLQTFFVLLSGAMLGKRAGSLSQIVYLTAGVAGAPVFSGWGFGFARIAGPTGGYLLSFPVAAFTIGYLLQGRCTILRSLGAMTVGLFIIFSLGVLYLNMLYLRDWSESVASGLAVFSWWDGAKLVTAAMVARAGRRSWTSPRGDRPHDSK